MNQKTEQQLFALIYVFIKNIVTAQIFEHYTKYHRFVSNNMWKLLGGALCPEDLAPNVALLPCGAKETNLCALNVDILYTYLPIREKEGKEHGVQLVEDILGLTGDVIHAVHMNRRQHKNVRVFD